MLAGLITCDFLETATLRASVLLWACSADFIVVQADVLLRNTSFVEPGPANYH